MTRKAIRNRWQILKKTIFRSHFRAQLKWSSAPVRRMRFESLEDRRLLALTPISVPEAAALRDTASAIGGFSTGSKISERSQNRYRFNKPASVISSTSMLPLRNHLSLLSRITWLPRRQIQPSKD